MTGVSSTPRGGAGVSVGTGSGTGWVVGVSTGVSAGRGVSVTCGSGMISGVAVSVGVADGTPVGVLVGLGVGDQNGRGVTVGITGSGVKVANGVGVANGVSVLVSVRVGEGVPGVFVTVGVFVGSGVGVEVGIGVLEGRGTLVLAGVPGPTVSLSSGGASGSKSGGSVPSGVGVKRLLLGPSSLTDRLHAPSKIVHATATGTNHQAAKKRPRVKVLGVREFDICRTITHAQRTFNFPVGQPARRMVT
ncbi:MAG: hypothetical protein M3437_18430 [Chloroflexota bacterium]|nr:hypothetical protein [Chloroflexota bacterium]MDQ5864131.1 hypothetical protein [Chloroflexota bacterium]